MIYEILIAVHTDMVLLNISIYNFFVFNQSILTNAPSRELIKLSITGVDNHVNHVKCVGALLTISRDFNISCVARFVRFPLDILKNMYVLEVIYIEKMFLKIGSNFIAIM